MEDQDSIVKKFFDCTESTIKEWLADYVKKDVMEIFPDYDDKCDVIGFEYLGTYYTAYVVTMPYDTKILTDKSLLEKSDKASKACSMLYDGVYQVFNAIINSYDLDIKSIVPVFVNEDMSFRLLRINQTASKLKIANEQNTNLKKYLDSLDKPMTDEERNMVSKIVNDINEIRNKYKIEDLTVEEELCRQENEMLTKFDRLYIVVEKNDKDCLDESLNRLPIFGIQYQDPNEETLIDKLKKEHGC